MKSYKNKAGLTLVETLAVLVVIVLLVSVIIGIAARIDNQGKERLAENTFALLDAALGQFQDYGYNYRDSDYDGFEFPLDCNDFNEVSFTSVLKSALGATNISIGGGVVHKSEYSGSEALYFFLSRVPESRQTLDKIDGSLITNKDENRDDITITVDGRDYPFLRIIDPWGKTLRYDYYDEDALNPEDMKESKKTFPVITSAGPDREFGTTDDMVSR